jgi:hypothetical protein
VRVSNTRAAIAYEASSMKTLDLLFLSLVSSVLANDIPNRLIDYNGFQKIVLESATLRAKNRLTEEQFLAALSDKNVVVLDARSANKYQLRHVKEAINLPFTDFTAETLARVIPSKDTKILIYCNNNFEGSNSAFPAKIATASLNLSTYTSLRSYGYENVLELGPLLQVDKTAIPFEGSEVVRKN